MRGLWAFFFACMLATPCFAQQARPSALAIDSAVAYDEAIDVDGNVVHGVVMDAVVSMGLGGGFEAIVRPWAQRLGSSGEWNRQIWLATLRYERTGKVGVRVDSGLIPPPVGYANMMLRAPLNPTIAMPSSLFQPLPAIEFRGPRTNLLGSIYPYGVSATVSMTHWDARAAVIDSAPMRMRRVFAETNPPRFANVVVGGGVTPFVGLRVGGSLTQGGWRRAAEVAPVPGTVASPDDAIAKVVTVESDYAVRHTKVGGEWVRDAIETASGNTVVASGWFLQGQQTLTPRWFAAGRIEQMAAPALMAGGTFTQQRLNGVEETIGYRLTPEITLRAGHRARRVFGRDAFAHTASFSVVWWKRWM